MQEFDKKQKFVLLFYLSAVVALLLYVPHLNGDAITVMSPSIFSDKAVIEKHSFSELLSSFIPHQHRRYEPLATILFTAEYSLAGESVIVYRGVNVLLHILNIFLFGVLLRKYIDRLFLVGFAMLVLAVHPVVAGTVLLIEECSVLLSSLFIFAGIMSYLKFRDTHRSKNFVIAMVLLFAAFLSGGRLEALVIVSFLCYRHRYYIVSAISFGALIFMSPFVFHHIPPLQNLSLNLREIFIRGIVWLIFPFQEATGVYALSSPSDLVFIISIVSYLALAVLFFRSSTQRIPLLLFVSTMLAIPVAIEYNEYVLTAGKLYGALVVGTVAVVYLIDNILEKRESAVKIFNGILIVAVFLCSVITATTLYVFDSRQIFWTAHAENQPSSVYFLNQSGLALQEAGNVPGAVQYFSRAIEADSMNALSYINRAAALKYTKTSSDALTDLMKAEMLAPSVANIYLQRGLIYLQTGLLDSAEQSLSVAIELQQGMPVAYNLRANVYVNNKQYVEALADYTKAISLDPTYGDAYGNRGIVKFLLSDIPSAMEDFEHHIQYVPYKVEPRIHLSVLKTLAGDTAEAHNQLRTARILDSANAMRYFYTVLPALTRRYYGLDSVLVHVAIQTGY